MNWLSKLFGNKRTSTTQTKHSAPVQTQSGYVCAGCGTTLVADDLTYANKREADARCFYGEVYKPGMPKQIIAVWDRNNKTFYCQVCLDSVANWSDSNKRCMNCRSFLSNFIRMGGTPDFYCMARDNQAIKDPLNDSCASWQLGRLFRRMDQPAPAKAEASKPATSLQCVSCSRVIGDFHYGFESMAIARFLGYQCASCGRVWCAEHAQSDIPKPKNKCPQCGGQIVSLEEGPAYSSMVEGAKRDGKYTVHFRPPDANRRVENG